MAGVTMPDLLELATVTNELCASLFMPTYPRGVGKQDALCLKNLAESVESQLIERGMRRVDARDFAAPLFELPHLPEWEHRKSGLAIFRSREKLVQYFLDTPFGETLAFGPRFYLRPLLPALGINPRFIVVAISRNKVRALKCTWEGCERLSLPGVPTNIEEALNLQSVDRGEQVHSGMRGDFGKEAGVFHGQGGHRDTIKEESLEYFRLVDKALRIEQRAWPWPVVLAGVDYEVALYRAAADNSCLADEFLRGGFDYVTDRQLYEQALPIARRIVEASRQQAFSKFRDLFDRKRAVDNAEEIISAAFEGKVETLFTDCSAKLYGHYDPVTKTIASVTTPDPMNDLIELAIRQTLRHAGDVYSAASSEMPNASPMCATLRF